MDIHVNVPVTVLVAVLALAGTIAAPIISARVAARNKTLEIQQEDREAWQWERDSDCKRIKDLEDRDAMWEQRCNTLWQTREADAIVKRRMGDHIDVLEDHIHKQLPPPPPPRPAGI